MSDALQQAITTLSELKRMHQLNFELLEQLNVACQWLIDSKISFPNEAPIKSLLRKSLLLLAEIQADEPKLLQYQKLKTDESLQKKRTDKDFTEPRCWMLGRGWARFCVRWLEVEL